MGHSKDIDISGGDLVDGHSRRLGLFRQYCALRTLF